MDKTQSNGIARDLYDDKYNPWAASEAVSELREMKKRAVWSSSSEWSFHSLCKKFKKSCNSDGGSPWLLSQLLNF